MDHTHRPNIEGGGEGAMPPYHQIGSPMYEGAPYGAEGDMTRGPYMGGPPVMNYMMPPPNGSTQSSAMGNPMGRPPSMGAYPPGMPPQNPGNPMYSSGPGQQKPYPGSMEQAMMSYAVSGQPLQIQPQPPGAPGPAPPSHYDYGHGRPHMMESVGSGYPVQRSASFQNKMAPMAPPDNYVNMQGKAGMVGQSGPGPGGYPGNLYLPPHSHPRQNSPTSHQVCSRESRKAAHYI